MQPSAPVPRRVGRPAASSSEETRARILLAARDCFAAFGYSRATNALIGELAGVTAGSVYHYYASKADLFVAVGRAVAQRVESSHAMAVRGAPTLRGKLCAVVEAFVRTLQEDRRLAQFLVVWSLELERQSELDGERRKYREATLRFYERLVDDAKVRGEVPDEANPRGLADGVQAVLLGLSVLASQSSDELGGAGAEDPGGEEPLHAAGRTLSALVAGSYFGPSRHSSGRS